MSYYSQAVYTRVENSVAPPVNMARDMFVEFSFPLKDDNFPKLITSDSFYIHVFNDTLKIICIIRLAVRVSFCFLSLLGSTLCRGALRDDTLIVD